MPTILMIANNLKICSLNTWLQYNENHKQVIIYYHPGLNHFCILDATAQVNIVDLRLVSRVCRDACQCITSACAANDFHWCFWADLGPRIDIFKCLGSSKSKMFQVFTACPYLTCITLWPRKIPLFLYHQIHTWSVNWN